MIIRALKPEDRADWQMLWDGYLTFYDVDLADDITQSTWSRVLERAHGFFALVAEDDDGRVIGSAHCLIHSKTWDIAPCCYLEDLFVAQSERGRGIGRALMEAVVREARRLGAGDLYWFTNKGNKTARQLYDQIGKLSDFVRYDQKLR